MNLCFQDDDGVMKPYYMGCYGIGLGRIIAAILEDNIIYKDGKVKGFSIPYNVAPYKVHIIYSEVNHDVAFSIYNKLLDSGVSAIIDDRADLSLGSRINDVYLLGTPKFIVIGNKFDGNNVYIENTFDGVKECVKVYDIVSYFKG